MIERFAIVDRRIDDTRSDMLERFAIVDVLKGLHKNSINYSRTETFYYIS